MATGKRLRFLVLFGVFGLTIGESYLDVVVKKNGGEKFQLKTSVIGDASQPVNTSDLDDWLGSCRRPDTFLPTTLAFPDGSRDVVLVDLCEDYVVVWSANQSVQQLTLPCTGHHLSNGTASLIIACSSEARLLELYKKEDGRYAIDEDEVFSTSGATTIARVGSGFMYTLNGNVLMHKASITNGDSPEVVTVIASLDCGTPYPVTFTDTHILLECSNGKWYLCSVTGGDCNLLNLPLFAKIAPSPAGVAAVLSSSTLTIYTNIDFDSSCPLVTLEDSNVTLRFFQNKVFIKSLNTFHYLTTSPCSSEPTLLDTFVGVPQCFTGDCTDYVTSDRYLAITTMDDNLAEVLTYNITTMEKLDYSVRYHSVPILYNIVERATTTITSTTTSPITSSTATTVISTNSSSTAVPSNSTHQASSATVFSSPTSKPKLLQTHVIGIIIVAAVVVACVIVIVVSIVLGCCVYRNRRKRDAASLSSPVQVESQRNATYTPSSTSTSSSSIPAIFTPGPPIQATEH